MATELNIEVLHDDCACQIDINDNTGFYPDVATGFLTDNAARLPDYFKLSDGYLFNLILDARYNGDDKIYNASEPIVNIIPSIETGTPNPTYEELLLDRGYSLSKDGSFTIKRLFVISKYFYEQFILENVVTTTKTIIYYDEEVNTFFRVEAGGELVPLCLVELAKTFDQDVHFGLETSYKVFSICNLKKCFYLLQKELIDDYLGLGFKSSKNSDCKSGNCFDYYEQDNYWKADFIHNLLHVVQYLLECNMHREALRYLESISICNTFCREVGLRAGGSGCGCN